MDARAAKLQEIRDRQNRWLRERQADIDRRHVVAELQQQQLVGGGATGGAAQAAQRGAAPGPSQAPAASSSSSASNGRSGVSGGAVPLPPLTAPGLGASSGGSGGGGGPGMPAGGGVGGCGGGLLGALPSTLGGVGGVKPEEVIDRLTERLTDRLRSELKVELQRESESLAAQQNALDTYLVKEMENQNTCSICYELMVPPKHAPMMLFPCGHTFCLRCLEVHVDRNRKTQCPYCRTKIESRAPNYSLQHLIQQVVTKKEAAGRGQQGGLGPRSPGSPGGRGLGLGGEGPQEGMLADPAEAGSSTDRVRRQYERATMRVRVLQNELADTVALEGDLGGKVAAAAAVVMHLQEEEQQVLRRLAAVQAELDLVREQLGAQGAKVADLSGQAEEVRQRRELLQATLGPLALEVEKLELLMEGVREGRT